MTTLLKAETLERLQVYLVVQRDVTNRARKELSRVTDTTPILYAPDGTYAESTTSEILRKIQALLNNYAMTPTMSEFTASPAHTSNWGGSFGVSSVIGTVMLKTLMDSFPEFSTSVKLIFIKVLRELYMAHENTEEDRDQSMMERVMENLNFSIRDKNGRDILGEQRDKLIKNRVALLLEVIAKVLEDYGLTMVEREGDQIASAITPLGIRVYLHIIDVDRYVQEVTGLYTELSAKKLSV